MPFPGAILQHATSSVIRGTDRGTGLELFKRRKQAWPGPSRTCPAAFPCTTPSGACPAAGLGAWSAGRTGKRQGAQVDAPRLVSGGWPVQREHGHPGAARALDTGRQHHDPQPSILRGGCQKRMIRTTRGQKADYVLALKGNQPQRHAAVAETFSFNQAEGRDHDCHRTVTCTTAAARPVVTGCSRGWHTSGTWIPTEAGPTCTAGSRLRPNGSMGTQSPRKPVTQAKGSPANYRLNAEQLSGHLN